MEKLSKPSVVFFDLDNTLYDYESAHKKAITSVEKKVTSLLGIEKEEFHSLYAEAKNSIKLTAGKTASSHNRLLYFQKLLELKGFGQQVLTALDLHQTYWNNFLLEAELYEGVLGLFDELRIHDIKIGLITDLTIDIQFRKLVKFGIHQFFDSIVTSEEVNFDKPNSKCFELALTKLNGMYDLEKRIWMIGDDEKKDIIASKKSINAITFLKKSNKREISTTADYQFSNFQELQKILRHAG